ncbi:MAG: hypothetical protein IT478_05415 [Xanthomonadales bacterium]|nr:hypothetical protein [Xanthomonadales bacterium]
MPISRIALVLFGLVLGCAAPAGGPTIVRIANHTTPNPGGYPPGYPQGTLSGFSRPMADGDQVTFRANVQLQPNTSTDGGIYRGDGGPLTVIADVFTSTPGGGGNLGAQWGISLGAERVAFTALTQASDYVLLAFDGASLLRIADDDDPAPSGSHPYNGFGMTAIDGDDIAFVAWEQVSYRPGLYLHSGGGTTLIAAGGMPLPEDPGHNFQRIDGDNLALEAGLIAFVHENSSAEEPIGIYRHSGGITSRVVDLSTPVPGGTGSFTDLQISGHPMLALDRGRILFEGVDGAGKPGLYLAENGTLSRVLSTDANRPPGVATIHSFRGFDLHGQVVVFAAEVSWARSGEQPQGVSGPIVLCALTPAGYEFIARTGDALDGYVVQSLYLSPHSFDSGRVAFEAHSQADWNIGGVYRTTVDWIFGDGTEGP